MAREDAGEAASAALHEKLQKTEPLPSFDHWNEESIKAVDEQIRRVDAARKQAENDFSKTPEGKELYKVFTSKPEYKARQDALMQVVNYIDNPANRQEVLAWYASYRHRTHFKCGPGYPDEPNVPSLYPADGTEIDLLTFILDKIEALKPEKTSFALPPASVRLATARLE